MKNFKRIRNNEIMITKTYIENIYNQIRMRDADTYENTFIKIGKFKVFLKMQNKI